MANFFLMTLYLYEVGFQAFVMKSKYGDGNQCGIGNEGLRCYVATIMCRIGRTQTGINMFGPNYLINKIVSYFFCFKGAMENY